MSTKVAILTPLELEDIVTNAIEQYHSQGDDQDFPEWPEYLTAAQAAVILKIKVRTFRVWAKRYELKTRENSKEKYLTTSVLQLWRDKRDLVL